MVWLRHSFVCGFRILSSVLKENSASRPLSDADFKKVLPANYIKMITFCWRQISIVIVLGAAWNGCQTSLFLGKKLKGCVLQGWEVVVIAMTTGVVTELQQVNTYAERTPTLCGPPTPVWFRVCFRAGSLVGCMFRSQLSHVRPQFTLHCSTFKFLRNLYLESSCDLIITNTNLNTEMVWS